MGRPRQFTDDQLIDAARACFLKHGPDVSTATIAEALGVSQAALFKRFGSKRELLLAALRPPDIAPLLAVIEPGPVPGPIAPQLEHIADTLAAFFAEMVPRMGMLRAAAVTMPDLFGDCVPPPVRVRRALEAWFGRAQAAGQLRADASPSAAAMTLIGGLQAEPFFRHVGQMHGIQIGENHPRDTVRVLLHGLAPRASSEFDNA